MLIKILRHGETEYNREWRFLGRKDLPLTEEGRNALFPSGERPASVYVSGLQRTLQTAQIIYPGAEYISIPELNEMDFGSFEGKTWAEMQNDPEFVAWIASDRYNTCPGGEGRREFSERVCKALLQLVKQKAQEGTQEITMVVHGGTIMAAMERFCTDIPGEYLGWRFGNGEGYLLEASLKGEEMRWHVVRRLSYLKSAGRVHLYYGEGRGKTSIAMGTALRAVEQGFDVTVVQFCKKEGSGETKQLEKLGASVFYGKETPGFVSAMSEAEKEQLKIKQTKLLENVVCGMEAPVNSTGRLLVLDEVCAALEQKVLEEEVLWKAILRKPSNAEIIMTGRHPTEWMIQAADYATELKEIRHPYQDGLNARKGIEF